MAGCKGSEDDSERERGEEEEEEDRGEEAAWVEAMACGGRQKGMLLSFVSRAYFGAFRLSWRDPFRGRREREGKDRRRLVRGCERRRKKFGGGEGGRRRRSLRLPKETREVWMVFEECHVIIGPPFERPFQREAAPPLGSARFGSARFRSSAFPPQLGIEFAQPLRSIRRSIFPSLNRYCSKILYFDAIDNNFLSLFLDISVFRRFNF